MKSASSYMAPTAERTACTAPCPCRKTAMYSVRSPSEMAPAAARPAMSAYIP